MNDQDIVNFDLHVDLAIGILKTQDLLMIESFKRGMMTLVEPEYLKEVMLTALSYLADVEEETFEWAVHHYDDNFYRNLRQDVALAAVRKLIRAGMTPGKDFSILASGGLAIYEQSRFLLTGGVSPMFAFVLREILFIFKTRFH